MAESDLDRWDRINNILGEIFGETEEQHEKWGEQDHPNVTPQDPEGIYLLGRRYRDFEKIAKLHFSQGERSWALIEFEELMEAAAERDPAKARAEWVQVAAVAVTAIANFDRRGGIGPEGPAVLAMDAPSPFTDVFLPGDGSVIVDGTIRVTPEEIDANYAKDLVEDFRPTEAEVRAAECVINDPGASTDDVASADSVLRGAEADGFRPNVAPEPGHEHTFDRLHGLCRCGETKDSVS